MAIFIASAEPIYCYADAASLTIMGSIGTEGLTIASYSGMLPYAAAVVGGVLIATGINVKLTEASQAAGKTKTEFIKDSITSYCSAASRDTGEFVYNILSDIRVGNQGAIEMGSRATTQVKQLVNWLFANDKVYDDNAQVGAGTANAGGVTFPVVQGSFYVTRGDNNDNYYQCSVDKPVAITVYQGPSYRWYVFAFSTESFTFTDGNTTHQADYYATKNVYYYAGNNNALRGIRYGDLLLDCPALGTNNTPYEWLQRNYTSLIMNPTGSIPQEDTFTGSQAGYNTNSGALSPSAGNTTVLNPDILGDLVDAVQGIANANISIEEYLKAIGIAIDGLRGGIKVRDVDTDAVIDVVIPAIDTFDPDISQDTPQPSGTDPAIDPNAPADVDVEVDGLKMDLKSIFPFCIPFDVVDMIKLLDAEPVAPSYTVNWNIPIINRALTFEVDLSPFNGVAAILRNLEIILFCIGLAMVTRSMFIRG